MLIDRMVQSLLGAAHTFRRRVAANLHRLVLVKAKIRSFVDPIFSLHLIPHCSGRWRLQGTYGHAFST